MRRLGLTVAALLLCLPMVGEGQEFIRYYPPAGLSAMSQSATGVVSTLPFLAPSGTASLPGHAFSAATEGPKTGMWFDSGSGTLNFAVRGTAAVQISNEIFLKMSSVGSIAWGTGAPGTTLDLYLSRAAAGTLLQASGNSTQRSRISAGFSGYGELGTLSEEITLSTGGATTDSAANLLPANSEILSITYRVTTAITTAVNFSIGDATTAARFVSGATGVAAGETGVGLLHKNPDVAAAAGPVQTAAAKIRITANTTPGAGAIRVQVFYRTYSPPAT